MAYTTINKSTDYFNTKLYTGNATTNHAQTGVGFQPDWLWIKERGGSGSHILVDSVRGVSSSSSPFIRTNANGAETTNNLNDFIKSLDSDGFTLGADSYFTDVNKNNSTYTAWNWKAGNSAGSSNTDGSINTTSTSVNTTAGFSISKYTGTGSNATIGHGLGAVPKMIIVKNLDQNDDWYVYHVSRGATKHIILNSTGTGGTNSTLWQDTTPTSSVFSIGTNNVVNTNGEDYIAYCFAEKTGYNKFGSYTGNGSTNGTFVYTGFKPVWVMIKNQTSGSYKSWSIFDTTRQTVNVNAGKTLYANQSYPEGRRGQGDSSTTIPAIDMLSNGFKCRVLNDEVNTTNDYIYMAFGQTLVGSNNVPATAR